MRRRTLATVLSCVAFTGACGTTLNVSDAPGGTPAGENLEVTTAPPPITVGHPPARTPPQQTGAVPGLSGSPAHAETPTPPTSLHAGATGSPTKAAPTTAPVTTGSGPVRVGVLYVGGVSALASALGIPGLSTGDPSAQAKAIADYINPHGGLAGRPIALYPEPVNVSLTAANTDSAYAAACAGLVQDDKVSFVVSYTNLSAIDLACYVHAGVTVLDDQAEVPDSTANADENTFAAPGELAVGRATVALVDDLWRRGWLNSKSKVGALTWDTPDGQDFASHYLAPALSRHGLALAATAYVSQGTSGANQAGSVLQFRTKGVNRIIPIATSPLFFMEAAQTQGYHPEYAVTSIFGPGALVESTAPKAQLTGAAGIGWDKYLDIGAGKMPGPVSGNETLCFKIMAAAGQQSSSNTVKTFQTALCNDLLFLQAASKRFGLGPDMLTLARQARFGFPPADAFAIRLEPGRADGVSAYRDVSYETSCGCFQYTSGNRALPAVG
ncbi:MAG TPA: hypothetical protein VG899_15415 [Mycobacteriales bacterium]|nr:hypothetical protein [Mycobacteriales bacterium]